jgi:hypothetical protein
MRIKLALQKSKAGKGGEVADAVCVIVRGVENSESADDAFADRKQGYYVRIARVLCSMLSVCLQHVVTYLASLEATRSGSDHLRVHPLAYLATTHNPICRTQFQYDLARAVSQPLAATSCTSWAVHFFGFADAKLSLQ